MAPINDHRFADAMRQLLHERGMSYRRLSAATHYSSSYLNELATGKKAPPIETAERIDEVLGADGRLAALAYAALPITGHVDEELESLELLRRVEASDLGAESLTRLEAAVDELAMSYATVPPHLLLPRARRHLAYVARLVDARATLTQRRRLLVVGGWLSLLAATLDIDLRQTTAAEARLTTAQRLAEHAEHPEITAWCLETRAWDALTAGDYRHALDLSRQAQAVAPRGSSAQIQATAQEGRVWARIGDTSRTIDALNRVARLTSNLERPDRPEHHYRYDPAKAVSYTATTLAWVGDPAAEEFARETIRQLESAPDGVVRPRRVASARLDLGLALLAAGKPDEAAGQALAAIASGRIVPSNWWRVVELVDGIVRAGLPEAGDLIEAMHSHQPSASAAN